ncbi:DNA polymerase eta isoform X4 [Magnolia sinica]|uniref:DNA polymerase eta isoform X4 n=1 Tax=Magnolia sinica TaxID=86752 RepID=UPI00265B0932|nr:DNA polymerase eta isoform X4 [Magnolia sinica]
MPIARPEPQEARVIAHIDLDCFYVQVEQRKQPGLRGLPTAVVQYNSWKGGGLIAVGYEARRFGVKRSMRGDEAKKVCPDIQLIQVPVARGKADLKLYRNAGSEVVSVLARKGRCERASIDEVYLDLTDTAESMLSENPPEILEEIHEEALKSHVLGLNVDSSGREETVKEWLSRNDADHQDKLLACGAIIVAELWMQVLKETEFTCSAGIAHNKMLAKLASGMHKPAQQTVVPSSCVKDLLASLPIKKMKQLGGKLGSSLQSDLGVSTVGDLLQFSEQKLQERYGINTGTWLWNIARGISGDEVEGRLLPKSHGCAKTFPGPKALKTIASGTCSILRFFHGDNPSCSSSKQAFDGSFQDGAPSSPSGSESCLGLNQAVQQKTCVRSGNESCSGLTPAEQQRWYPHEESHTQNVPPSSDRGVSRSQTWEYKVEEIDPAVIDELPLEIQAEVRGWLRPHKRPNMAKRGHKLIKDIFEHGPSTLQPNGIKPWTPLGLIENWITLCIKSTHLMQPFCR